jgi:hypothetical protein
METLASMHPIFRWDCARGQHMAAIDPWLGLAAFRTGQAPRDLAAASRHVASDAAFRYSLHVLRIRLS